MKRSYYVLIGGATILAVGLALTVIWALPLAEEIERSTTILQGRQLDAGQSATATREISDTTKPLSIVVSAESRIQMGVELIDPEGNRIYNATFLEAMAEATGATVPGTYELVVTNQSTSDTRVDVVFGHIPGVGERDIDTETFRGVVAGIAVIIAGVMVLIGGVAVWAIDRHASHTKS